MQSDSTFTYLEELMESLHACILEGSLNIHLSARQEEVNLDLMAIAHLQTTIAAHVLLLSQKLLKLPCEIRESILKAMGITQEDTRAIVCRGGDITCSDAFKTASACLQTVMRCMEQNCCNPEETP